MSKVEMEVEKLLVWAYQDELSKRQTSAAEGIWDRILDYSNHGGIDSGHGAAQRYAHFGLPDPDAERIERAISALDDYVVDWNEHFEEIAGDLAGLISVNDLSRRDPQARAPKVGWGQGRGPKVGWDAAGDRALRAFFGPQGARPAHDRPRDVIMVGGIKAGALIVMHAIKGTRPDWSEEPSHPEMVPAARGNGPTIVGECKGKNLYATGSYCPLSWWPSPMSIVSSRCEYFAWHQQLAYLAETLVLEKFAVLPPRAPRMPWADPSEEISRVIPVVPTGKNDVGDWGTLPLLPTGRPKAGPMRRQRADPVRHIDPSV